uniref:Uncharacterized protein n=1 Tax=Meloidogyne enterolobii TaxID=390850 RepID=A0A6V7VLI4_MELEN|nr:unnamed protein product [Meloidogyne enterolobii]
MISLRQLMTRQRQFLPNEQARRFAHIPKLLYMLGDNLLRMVFGPQGIYYAPLTDKQHHARSCTFGTIHVNWRNAFTPKGKLQVRQVVNLFARCSAFPYEKDQNLIGKFQQISLVTIDSLIKEMDISQLLPSSSNDNGNEINNDNQKLDEITKQIEDKTPINEISDEAAQNGGTSLDEEQNLNIITEELPEKNKLEKNSKLPISAGNSIERPTTMDSEYDSYYDNNNEFYLFDIQDLHTNKDANLYADWQCIVFYVCNILSYLTGENYDSVVDLLTFWFAGDSNRDVKQAIYCHMRDLFARNMRQQEQQATAWRRRMGLPEKLKN